jgi:hypothetical protein
VNLREINARNANTQCPGDTFRLLIDAETVHLN